jgi:Flp pilus assembly protein TadG
MVRRTIDRQDAGRRGSFTVELLLVLPILMTVVLGAVEFSMLAQVRQQLLIASREGTRVAALGGTPADVQTATQNALGAGVLQNATIQINITDNSGNPLPSGQPVSVIVTVQAGQAVPDLLAFIGYSIGNELLAAQTVMRKE